MAPHPATVFRYLPGRCSTLQHALAVTLAGLLLPPQLAAQDIPNSLDVRVFSHAESMLYSGSGDADDFSLGESTLFVTGSSGNKWSFLSETTFRPSKYRKDTVLFERLSVQYDLAPNSYIAFGKIHTPINYWNDTYHHGRIFFPTINRPLAMTEQIPLHEIALRVGARNLGTRSGFYDIVLGSGQVVTERNRDPFADGVRSVTLMAGFTPADGWQIQAALMNENMSDHTALGTHSHDMSDQMAGSHGTASAHGDHSMHMQGSLPAAVEPLNYSVASVSIVHEGGRFKALTEMSASKFEQREANFAFYQYLGLRTPSLLTPYAFYDATHVGQAFHFEQGTSFRYGLGLDTSLGAQWSLKTELSRRRQAGGGGSEVFLQAQLSVGF